MEKSTENYNKVRCVLITFNSQSMSCMEVSHKCNLINIDGFKLGNTYLLSFDWEERKREKINKNRCNSDA